MPEKLNLLFHFHQGFLLLVGFVFYRWVLDEQKNLSYDLFQLESAIMFFYFAIMCCLYLTENMKGWSQSLLLYHLRKLLKTEFAEHARDCL